MFCAKNLIISTNCLAVIDCKPFGRKVGPKYLRSTSRIRVTCSLTGFFPRILLLVDAGVNSEDNDRASGGLIGVSLAICGVALRARLFIGRP